MSKEYKFSINIYIDNESLLETTISSLVSDKDFFRSSVQLVLIDSLVTDESTELCLKYTDEFPENIYFVDCQGKSMAESFNDARVICLGSYLTFIRSGDVYSRDTLRGISESAAFMKAPAICIAAETSRTRNDSVPYSFIEKDGVVNLKLYPDRVGLILGAYFFKNEAVAKLRFRKTFANDFATGFILDLLTKTKSYLYTSRFTFSTVHSAENDIKHLKGQYYKSYFTDSITRFAIPMLEGKGDSPIVMNIVMYLIYIKLSCGLGDRYMFTMGANSVNDFLNLISDTMQMIDDAIILNRNLAERASLPSELTFKALRLKYRNKALKPDIDFFPIGVSSEYEYRNFALIARKVKTNGCFTATLGGAIISSSDYIDVRIMSINLEGSSLRFSGYVTDVSCLDRIDYELFAVANREKIPFKSYPFYSLKTLYEIPFDKGNGFTFAVPLKNVKEMTVISFFIALGGMSYKLKFSFGATGAHLSEKFPHSYFVVDGRMVTFDLDSRSITIRRATSFMQSKSERLFLADIKHSVPMQKYMKIKRIRKRYFSSVDKYADRKIWLMCDRENANSEDGRALYDYINSLQNKRGVEAFYSQRGINPDDAFLMTAFQSTSLACGSIAQKLIAMNADVIVAGGHNVYEILGFEDGDELYYRDLLMADIISFGNGFSMSRSAQTENRVYDNTALRFCGSKAEYERLSHPIYGYDKKHLFAFGYPHIDKLISVPSRQILVCPAMRRGFGKYSHIGYHAFTKEPLYSVFNALINDKRVLDCLAKYRCTMVLILPEEFAKKEYLWNKSENVTVSSFEELGYTETIEKSAMLITDYDNTAFDFAYMRKPIIYYQNPDVSCQDNISSFSYREQGFGAVVDNIDSLVDELRKIVEAQFMFPTEYTSRRESFFAFCDRNNCKRIANAIYDFKYNNKVPTTNVTDGFGDPEKPQAPPHTEVGKKTSTASTSTEKRPNAEKPYTHKQKPTVKGNETSKPSHPRNEIYSTEEQQIDRTAETAKRVRPTPEKHLVENPPVQQTQQQAIRYAEAQKKPRQELRRPTQPRPSGSETAERRTTPQQSVRYAEPPKNVRPAARPAEKPRKSGGARYADKQSTSVSQQKPRRSAQRPSSQQKAQRAADSRTPARRAAERQTPPNTPQRQAEQRPRQNASAPRHATPDKRNGGFRRF